jgi:hypothetical protein
MSSKGRPSMWSTDLTKLCERLAERLRAEGAPHPEPAAVALAVRGASGEDRHDFAIRLCLTDEALAHIERGEVSLDGWPLALIEEATTVGCLERGEPDQH